MEWTEIIMKVPSDQLERAADIAQMAADGGIYVEDYSHLEEEAQEIAHIDLIDKELLQKDREHGLVHLYISPEEPPREALAFLQERCAGEALDCELSTESCAEEDWINNWKRYFHPIPVGEKLLIRPTWEDTYDAQSRTVLHLEPGLAFGTGTHETTRLCLELLENYLRPGMSLLDVGCGSGILSVAGLLLGAGRAVGVDIDPLAVKTALENAKTNGVEERFQGICGNLTDQVTGKYDLVVANIVADVILLLTKDIERYLNRDTVYLMSGIIDTRVQEVRDALAPQFAIIEERQEKGWFALAAKLKN